MANHIEQLFELCKEQPFDTEKIQNYITTNKMNSEQITQTAIKLCEYGIRLISICIINYKTFTLSK